MQYPAQYALLAFFAVGIVAALIWMWWFSFDYYFDYGNAGVILATAIVTVAIVWIVLALLTGVV